MEIQFSAYVFAGFMALFAVVGIFVLIKTILPFKNQFIIHFVAIAFSITLTVSLGYGAKKGFHIGEPVIFAEVDSKLLLKKFIFAEAKSGRPKEDFEKVSGIFAKAFDNTINSLAIKNGWIVLPKDTAVIGRGVRFDATEIAEKQLIDTLQSIGYEYIPEAPSSPDNTGNEGG